MRNENDCKLLFDFRRCWLLSLSVLQIFGRIYCFLFFSVDYIMSSKDDVGEKSPKSCGFQIRLWGVHLWVTKELAQHINSSTGPD